MMRRSDYATTRKYINMAAKLNTVTDRLKVPDLVDKKHQAKDSIG